MRKTLTLPFSNASSMVCASLAAMVPSTDILKYDNCEIGHPASDVVRINSSVQNSALRVSPADFKSRKEGDLRYMP